MGKGPYDVRLDYRKTHGVYGMKTTLIYKDDTLLALRISTEMALTNMIH